LQAALEHRPDPASERSRDSERDEERGGERAEEPRSWFTQQLEEIRRQQAEQALDHDRGEGIEI